MNNIQMYTHNVNIEANTILITGKCPNVKMMISSKKLDIANKNGYKTIIIDFHGAGKYENLLKNHGYNKFYDFYAGKDNYAYDYYGNTLREQLLQLREFMRRENFEKSKISECVKLIQFLSKLEKDMDIESSKNIKDMLKRFSTQEILEKILLEEIKQKKKNKSEAHEYIQTYLEYIGNGICIDAIISELDLILKPQYDTKNFTLFTLGTGEAAVIYADNNNSTDINDYVCRMIIKDIIKMAEEERIFIIINSGNYSQICRIYELVETLSKKPKIMLLYCTDDLFYSEDNEKAYDFAKMFNYNIIGRQSAKSAEKVSEMFPEHWIEETIITTTKSNRIFDEKIWDKYLGTDNTVAIAKHSIKERIFTAEYISKLDDNQCIILDTNSNNQREVG